MPPFAVLTERVAIERVPLSPNQSELEPDTLPAFYSRSSGLPVDVRVESPVEAAQVLGPRRSRVAIVRTSDRKRGVTEVLKLLDLKAVRGKSGISSGSTR